MSNVIYRQFITPGNKSELLIQLPETFINKDVEVLAFEIPEPQIANGNDRQLALKDTFDFFDSISVDTSDFKFNRDEANER